MGLSGRGLPLCTAVGSSSGLPLHSKFFEELCRSLAHSLVYSGSLFHLSCQAFGVRQRASRAGGPFYLEASGDFAGGRGPRRMNGDLLADGEGTPCGRPIVGRVLACAGKSEWRAAVRELRRKPEHTLPGGPLGAEVLEGSGCGLGLGVGWLPLQGDCLLYLQEHPFFTSHKTKKTDIAAFVKEILGEDS